MVDTVDLSPNRKQIFANKLKDLVPHNAKLTKRVPFDKRKLLGEVYRQPVVVRNEHGYSYAAPNAGVFSLNDPRNMVLQDAQIRGHNMVLRAQLSYERVQTAMSSDRAFESEIGLTTKTMERGAFQRLEISMFYGQDGLGSVAAGAYSNTSATVTVVTITDAEWAAGIWSSHENAKLLFNDSTGTLVSSGDDADFVITTVDGVNKKLTLTGTATGITALETVLDSGVAVPFFEGTRSTADMLGLYGQITNTGTSFNIAAGTYGLWKSNTLAVTGALNFAKLQKAVSLAVGRGLSGEVDVYINNDTWVDLASDMAANRMYDSSYKGSKGTAGHKTLSFESQNGMLNIIPHPIVKASHAFVLPPKELIRVGGSDISFTTPGGVGDEYFFVQLQDKSGYELRLYSNQGILLTAPAQAVLITGIQNTV